MQSIIAAVLATSFCLNLLLVTLLILEKRKARDRPKSVEAEELLSDLMRGPAIVRVEILNPANLLIRSPRQ